MSELQKPVGEMSKDELAEYAMAKYGVEIDKRRNLESLRAEVGNLATTKAKPSADSPPAATHPGYLKHRVNGRVYPATPELIARGDMIPVDAKGNPA